AYPEPMQARAGPGSHPRAFAIKQNQISPAGEPGQRTMNQITGSQHLHPFEIGPQSPLWHPADPAEIAIPRGNLVQSLIRVAEAWPERPAMHYYGADYDYARLLAGVEALAGWLVANGLQPGDRVILDMQNAPQFVIAFYGILRANGVVVPVNPMDTASEIDYFAEDSGARIAIVGEELLDRFTPHLGSRFDRLLSVRYADMAPV